MKWQNVERPGYFGKHREEKYRQYDSEYGQGNWRIAWRWDDPDCDRDFLGACAEYESSYYWFLAGEPQLLDLLVSEAYDVYDDSPSNIYSGISYLRQETSRTHLQDIAIRRSVVRLGRFFEGNRLVQIRDKDGLDSLSRVLSPGRVPFGRSGIIVEPQLEGWWQPNSVESFYQSNKVLQIKATGN